MTQPLLSLRNISAGYTAPRLLDRLSGRVPPDVISDISLDILAGEVVALIGESGSGKSTLGKVILGLMRPRTGEILFQGKSPQRDMHAFRRAVQVVFQDSATTLHPAKTILWSLIEPLRIHQIGTATSRIRDADAMLREVGLDPAIGEARPAALSGGQRQRVGIARALMLSPRLIVADEPVSALDISVQAQILNLLHRVQRDHALSILFVTHDIDVVHSIANRVAVMKEGRIEQIEPVTP